MSVRAVLLPSLALICCAAALTGAEPAGAAAAASEPAAAALTPGGAAAPFQLLRLEFPAGQPRDGTGNGEFLAAPQTVSDGGRDVLQLEKDACPLRLARPLDLTQGAVRVRIKFPAGRDLSKQGAHLLDLYAAPPLSFHTNRASRLTLHIYPFSKWSPAACTVFFILYDRAGNQPGHTLNFVCRANFENDRWYDIGANWDLRHKTGNLFIDGIAQSGETRFPTDWQGAEPAGLLTLGDRLTRLAEADLFPQPVSLRDEE